MSEPATQSEISIAVVAELQRQLAELRREVEEWKLRAIHAEAENMAFRVNQLNHGW